MPPHQSRSNSPSAYRPEKEQAMDLRRTHPTEENRSKEVSLDLQSHGSGSQKAPSSVYLAAPMARELSDLSGYTLNGHASRGQKGASVPAQIYDEAAHKGIWRHGYILSQPLPQFRAKANLPGLKDEVNSTIFVGHDDGVEIVAERQHDGSAELTTVPSGSKRHRIPVVLLLMDTNRKVYELMQIWVDKYVDFVRDVVHTMQQSIPDKWKHAYDGVFQMQGNKKFSQLINILSLEKYDAQPYEVWIAKPWSMTAKLTSVFATSCIRHLSNIGVVCTDEDERPGRRTFRPKSVESALILSKKAQSRIYAPDGIMDHHHAVHFITISPPLDPNRKPVELATERDADANSSLGSTGASQNSFPILAHSRANPASISIQSTESPSIPVSPLSAPSRSASTLNYIHEEEAKDRRRSLGNLLSQLYCCRANLKGEQNESYENNLTLITLTEEQVHNWATFDASRGEDQSVAGLSIVSMSAPLLSTTIKETSPKSRTESSFVAL